MGDLADIVEPIPERAIPKVRFPRMPTQNPLPHTLFLFRIPGAVE